MPKLKPPSLSKGDTICIISTARKISLTELEPAIELIESWGYNVQLGANLLAQHHQFAGTNKERTTDLQAAINDKNIKCILCARGGYGTVQIIDEVNFNPLLSNPKWIVGFSDVTVLHSHLNTLGIQSLHSTMPILFNQEGGELARESLKSTLSGIQINYEFNTHKLNRLGTATGQLVGGNLSIINSLTGTASHMDTTGKILFLEDLDEYLYHLDRMMSHLDRAGMLKGLAGLVIGGMSDMNDNTIPYGESAIDIICATVSKYTFPVAFNFPAGHIPDNRALILGADIELNVNPKGSTLAYL